MSGPPFRRSPVTADVEPPQRPSSSDGVRVRVGTWEVAAKGASAVYAVALAACIGGIVYVAPPLLLSIRETTDALREASATIRASAEDARAARQGVTRLEERWPTIETRLVAIEADVVGLRAELRACGRAR